MDVLEAIKMRRSVRQFAAKALPREELTALVDAGRFAPTARNLQPWHFVVVTRRDTLERLAGITEHGKFIAQCAACIAVYCEDTKYYLEDGCAATQNILLAASARGIGSCWVAGDKKPYCGAISGLLAVPPAMKLVSLIALGIPASAAAAKAIKPLETMLHWDVF